MKRRLWIAAAGIILVSALACGIELWRENRTIKWQADRIHELQHILTFAENKGADWATDCAREGGFKRQLTNAGLKTAGIQRDQEPQKRISDKAGTAVPAFL